MYKRQTQDRVTLEIQRGCIRGCRFCQAGMLYRPTREKDVETVSYTHLCRVLNTMQKAGDFIPRLFDKKNYYHPM